MASKNRPLLFALILEHLEAEGLALARSVVEDEYASKFGAHEAAELADATATVADKIQPAGDRKIGGGYGSGLTTKGSSLAFLLTSFQSGSAKGGLGNIPPAPSTPASHLPSPLKMTNPLVVKTSNQAAAAAAAAAAGTPQQQRSRGRRRSSLAVLTSDGGAVMSEQPLMPRPTPEWAGTEDIDDLELDEEGNVKGGTSLALLTWVCRCASMIQIYGDEEEEDKEVVEAIAMCEKDLTSYLMTFTDFTTPEDLVADLDTMLERNSEDAWSMQQFLLRWLEYDFDQVRPSFLFVCVSFFFFLMLVLLFHCVLLLMGWGGAGGDS